MGKIVSIELDPALASYYERVAGQHGRSLEAKLIQTLASSTRPSNLSRDELVALVQANWGRAPWTPGFSDSTALIREDRDSR